MSDVAAVTQGTLRTQDGTVLPLLQTAVRAHIDGPLASVVVTQTFRNVRAFPIEAVYSFPLPHEASVWRLEFRIGDRIVKGVIKERAAARRAYQAAKAEGRAATLLEEDSPAVFTLSVANVAPNAEIVVHLEYQEVVPYDDGRFVFVFPMVAPNLYRDGPPPAVADAMPPPRMLSPDRNADVRLEVHLAPTPAGTGPHSTLPVTEVRGRSHTVQPELEPNGTTVVRLGGPERGPVANRDFVLEWQVARGGVQPVLRLEPGPPADARGTFLLTLAPSRADAKTELAASSSEARPLRCGNCGALVTDDRVVREIAGFGPLVSCRHCGAMLAPATSPVVRASRARDVAIVFDRSASMRAALPHARELVMALVDALLPGDAITAMTFDHDRAVLDDELRWVAVGPEVGRRVAALLDRPARGGSDVARALETVAKLPVREGRTRTIVLVTDGAVGNTAKLLRGLPERLGPATRLHVLGVGEAVNRFFVESLARAGGGTSTIVTAKDDARLVRDRFARKVIDGGPILTDVTVSWEGAEPALMHPSPLPDLHGNQPLHVVGRYTGSGPSKLVITANTPAGAPFRQEIDVVRPPPVADDGRKDTPRLARIWARAEVKKLLERGARAEALALALEHSLASPVTSLIAEDSEISVRKVSIGRARLRVTRGTEPGRTYALGPGTTRIGRSPQADIVLAHGNVSRMHLEIHVSASGYLLRDLSSMNGTRVDGAQVREAKLEAPATLDIGSTEQLVFEYVPDEALELLPTETVTVADELDAEPHARSVSLASLAPPPPAAVAPPAPAFAPPPAPGMVLSSSPPVVPAPVGLRLVASSMAPPGAMPPPPPRAAARPSVGLGRAIDTPVPGSLPAATPLGVERLSAARRSSGSRIMRGSLEEVPLPDILQLFAIAKKTGTLAVSSQTDETGRISFEKGRIVAASIEGRPSLSIDEAVALMDPWDGHFELLPLDPGAAAAAPDAPIPQAPALLASGSAYPEAELAFVKHRVRGELDLALLVDATASMQPYIEVVRQRLSELLSAVASSPLCKSLRIAIVSYRDHPPEETSYASRVDLPFTDNVSLASSMVAALEAVGGGDDPEAVTDGLHDVVRLDWRPDAAKAIVWFGDAPPHGVEPRGDAFPGGCPCGDDWFSQAESCREMGITIYALGCLPTIRRYETAEHVFRTIARATRGMYLALHEASLLAPLIAGAAESTLDDQRIDEHVLDLVAPRAMELAATDETERTRWIFDGLRRRKIERRSLGDDGKPAFRDVALADVEASLGRLRAQARVAW